MEPHHFRDRRKTGNRTLSALVDKALICRAFLGAEGASVLFRAFNVPSTVAVRVLFHETLRRRSESGNNRAEQERQAIYPPDVIRSKTDSTRQLFRCEPLKNSHVQVDERLQGGL